MEAKPKLSFFILFGAFFFLSLYLFLILLTLSVGGENRLHPSRADGEIGKPSQLANRSLIPNCEKNELI